MSKQNKTNKNNYVQAGRLTPDDMARERVKMDRARGGADERATGRKRQPRGGPDATRPRSAPAK